MNSEAARLLAEEVSSLFSLPDVAVRACAVMDDPHATHQDLIEVVELDANLAATLLRLANSALYAGRGRVDSLERAVALLGHKTLRDLVLGTAAVHSFRDIPEEFVDMHSFWDNSITCAVLARLLADHLRLRQGETLFLAGLLHAVGRLVFYARRPEQYREALGLVHSEQADLPTAEQRVFGCSHAEVGAALLEGWGLPDSLTAPVRHHPAPAAAREWRLETGLLHLAADQAAQLSPTLRTAWEEDRYLPGPIAIQCLSRLGITPAAMVEIRQESWGVGRDLAEILHPCTQVSF